MKHIFVVNPKAGGHDCSDEIARALSDLQIDSEIYTTREPRDATRFVAERLKKEYGEGLRFYACGGDGTLNEVVTGVMSSEQRAEVACYPSGSGDDFVRYWQGSDFRNIQALVNGSTVPVDVMRLGDRYCVNTLNFGFEAAVCYTMARVRRVPLLGGAMAYTTGIVASLATGRHNRCRVMVDGEQWLDGEVLLLSVANGQYAGGGYHCAPRAKNDDGQLEVMAVKPMSVVRFAQLIKYYKNGKLLDREELRGLIQYRRGSNVVIDPLCDSYLATDGEIVHGNHFDVHCLHHAIDFVVPNNR